MNLKKIKRAIISVSNKSNLNLILPILKKYKIEIISSGGTFKKIQSLKYKCIEISDYTEFKTMLDGRIKTLHPKIYAGILNIRKNPKHHKEIKNLNMPNIDLVIVDLYPFEKKIKDKIKFKKLIEYIDIGGSTLIRAAAKNYEDVTVISATSDYSRLIHELKNNNGATSIKFRELMSAKAFSITAYYDSIISNWLNEKLITALLAILLALGGWNLSQTFSLSNQMVLVKEKVNNIEENIQKFSKKKPKKKKKKN